MILSKRVDQFDPENSYRFAKRLDINSEIFL